MMRSKHWLAVLSLVIALPLLTYPLSLLPGGSAQFRFGLLLPLTCVVLVVLLLLATRQLATGPVVVELPRPVVGPLALLVISWLLAIRFSQHAHVSVLELPVLFGNLAVFFLGVHFSANRIRSFCWCWVGVAVVIAANGLVRWGTEMMFASTFGNRNFLGAYLAASIVLCVALWDKRLVVPGLVLLLGLVVCRSRGAWLGLGAVVLVFFVAGFGNSSRLPVLRRAGLALVVVALALLLGWPRLRAAWMTEVRPVIWRSALHMIPDAPIVGHGLGTFVIDYPRFRLPEYFQRRLATNVTDHAHNEFLEVAAEQGILGLVALVWLWGTVLRQGVRSARQAATERGLRWGMIGAVVVLMVHGLLDVGLRYPPNQPLLWLLFGLLVSEADTVRFTLKSSVGRVLTAGICVAVAVWAAYLGGIQPVRADLWERRARLADERGDFAEAATAASQALEFRPFRLTTRYLLAGALNRIPGSKMRKLAMEQCLSLEELAPDYADTTFNLGRLYAMDHRPAEALPYLQRAVAINPYDANKRVALVQVLMELGQRDAAQTQLTAALTLDPQHGEARALQSACFPPPPH